MKKEVKEKEETEKVFAKGFSFYKLFIIFVVGSVIGVYYEEILHMVKVLMKTGVVEWVSRRGVIYGPFNPLYGAGFVLFIVALGRKRRPAWKTILYGALIGGTFEYFINLFQEIFLGTTSWNYSHQFLNIDGRTTIPIMLFWGIAAYILVEIFYPWLSSIVEKIPYRLGVICTNILCVFLCIDMLVSWTAVLRQTLRRNNIPPYTPVGKFYDRHYNDEFLEKYYPNMMPSKGGVQYDPHSIK